jgi:hypothetical protein
MLWLSRGACGAWGMLEVPRPQREGSAVQVMLAGNRGFATY